LFPQEEVVKFSQNKNSKGLNETVRGIINYFLSRDKDSDSWWGLDGSQGSAIRSADYLAWSARAIAFCLSVDQELREKTGEEWLEEKCGLEKGQLYTLLRQRWEALFRAKPDDLLSNRAEEPQTFTLGRVGLAYLDLLRLDPIKGLVLRNDFRLSFLTSLDEAWARIWRESLAQMSQYYLFPVRIVRDKYLDDEGEKLSSAQELVQLCQSCLESRIWIRSGSDQGSWGFNLKNSQALVTALAAFWRHAFERDHRERFEKAFETVGIPT
jgi:hypothetical protein